MDAATQRRRMARELGAEAVDSATVSKEQVGDTRKLSVDAPGVERCSVAPRLVIEHYGEFRMQSDEFMLKAQNRALSTNLFAYKRRIADLEAALERARAQHDAAADATSCLTRCIAELELALATAEARLGIESRSHGDAATTVTHARAPLLPQLLDRLARAEDGVRLASIVRSGVVPRTDAEADAAGVATPVTSMDSTAHARVLSLAQRVGSVTAALQGAASVSALQATADEVQAAREMPVALFYRDLAAAEAGRAAEVRAELNGAKTALHAAERTIARIEYDHPSVDVDAHRRLFAPHGMERFIEPPAGDAAVNNGAARSAEPGDAASSAQASNHVAASVGLTTTASSPRHAQHDAARVADSEALTELRQELASVREELAAVVEERDIMKELASDRLREAEELRGAVAALSAELHKMNAGVVVSEAAVVASPWYLAKIAEMTPLMQRVVNAEAAATSAGQTASSLQDRLARTERRLADVLSSMQTSTDSVSSAMTAALASATEKLAEVVKDRDDALRRAAEAAAAAAETTRARETSATALSLQASAQAHLEQYRSDWATKVAERVSVAAVQARLAEAGVAAPSTVEENAALTAERDHLMTMVQALSQGYEQASAEAVRITACLQERDEQLARLQQQLAHAVSERAISIAARNALQQRIDDGAAALNAAKAALAQQAAAMTALQEAGADQQAQLTIALAEVAAANSRAAAPTATSPVHLAMQVQELNSQLQLALSQVSEYQRRIIDADAQCKRLGEDLAAANRSVTKKDESVLRLRKRVAELEKTASDSDAAPAPLALRRSASASGIEDERTAALKDEHLAMMRARMTCSVCHTNLKDAVIAKCYHLFCKPCLDNNLKIRHRKCPACGQQFGADDVHLVFFPS